MLKFAYIEIRFITILLLDESFNQLPINSLKSTTSNGKIHFIRSLVDGSSITDRIEIKLLHGESIGTVAFPVELVSSNSTETLSTSDRLRELCVNVQKILNPVIADLLVVAGSSTAAYPNSSRGAPVVSTGGKQQSNANNPSPTHPAGPGNPASKISPRLVGQSQPHKGSPRAGAKLSRNVRLVYNNTVNRAMKTNVYKSGFEVGLLWPQVLPSTTAVSANANTSYTKTHKSTSRLEEISPVSPRGSGKQAPPPPTRVPLLSSISQSSLTSSSSAPSPFLYNELPRWLIRQLKTQYAIPASLLAGTLHEI